MIFAPPPGAKILVVGEAPGKEEELTKTPFIGAAGQLLSEEFKVVKIDRRNECAFTNVFDERPKDNKLEAFSVPKGDWLALSANCPLARKRKNPSTNLWIDPERVEKALIRLRGEIEQVKPNLILALGNIALWALTGERGITKFRGTILTGDLVPNVKILPTFHPASIFRQWANRGPFAADLEKAAREKDYPEIRRMSRKLWLHPTLDDLYKFEREHIARFSGPLSVDIETPLNILACIGLSRDPSEALILPFLDRSKPDWNYWPDLHSEVQAYMWLHRILSDMSIEKLFQNGLYDLQHLYRVGTKVRRACNDTMILHHSMYSSMQKGLDFLGSIYTDEIAWKLLRPRGQHVEKKDE